VCRWSGVKCWYPARVTSTYRLTMIREGPHRGPLWHTHIQHTYTCAHSAIGIHIWLQRLIEYGKWARPSFDIDLLKSKWMIARGQTFRSRAFFMTYFAKWKSQIAFEYVQGECISFLSQFDIAIAYRNARWTELKDNKSLVCSRELSDLSIYFDLFLYVFFFNNIELLSVFFCYLILLYKICETKQRHKYIECNKYV